MPVLQVLTAAAQKTVSDEQETLGKASRHTYVSITVAILEFINVCTKWGFCTQSGLCEFCVVLLL